MGRTGGGARRRAGDGVRRPGGRPPGRYGVLVGVAAFGVFVGVGRKAAAGMHSMPALEICRLCTTNGVGVGRSPKSVWISSAADGSDGGVRSSTLKHTMNASGWSGRGCMSSGVAVSVLVGVAVGVLLGVKLGVHVRVTVHVGTGVGVTQMPGTPPGHTKPIIGVWLGPHAPCMGFEEVPHSCSAP